MLISDKDLRGKTILIVDDQRISIELLSAYLRPLHVSITTAAEGKEALASTKANIPDLILLDAMMPVMDGFEVCRRLREKYETRDVPIIFITADSRIDTVDKCFIAGGSDFMSKPLNRVELLNRIKTQITLVSALRKSQALEVRVEGLLRTIGELRKNL